MRFRLIGAERSRVGGAGTLRCAPGATGLRSWPVKREGRAMVRSAGGSEEGGWVVMASWQRRKSSRKETERSWTSREGEVESGVRKVMIRVVRRVSVDLWEGVQEV